jgi:vacuolar protein sorting-associated protein VTA1
LSFGELSEEAQQNRKYAKWKAAYIHNCLKNGETPIPGPMQGENDEATGGENLDERSFDGPGPSSQPSNPPFMGFQPIQPVNPTQPLDDDPFKNLKPPSPPKMEMEPPGGFLPYNPPPEPAYVAPMGDIKLTPEQMSKAQKYCKWAGSALNYDDVKTAIDNLQKGLRLLQTGKDG